MTLSRVLLVAVSLVLPHLSLFGQEYRATLLGVITDASGAAVSDGEVTVTNIDTEVRASTRSSADGNYLVPFLQPGKYRLRIERAGFKSFERSPIELRVNDRVRVDAQLQVGRVSEQITITAESPLLETESGGRGQVLGTRAFADLPVNGKNPWVLVGLAAGVQHTGGLTFFRPQDGTPRNVSINGGRPNINEYQVDGQPRNNQVHAPPVEAVQEMKVQTNTYDAQFGRTAGGVINVSLKPGTNSLHGAAYEYLRRTPLNANQFANNAAGRPRVEQPVDQFGFELDGPVMIPGLYRGKDRTFFMVAWERYKEFQPQPVQGTVPTALERSGDFSQTRTAAGRVFTIYDPLTIRPNPAFDSARAISATNLQYLRMPFPGNVVPQARINPIATRVLQDIPLPNQPGDPVTNANNWFGGDVGQNDRLWNLVTRLDHNFSDRWRVFGKFDLNRRSLILPVGKYGWNTAASPVYGQYRYPSGAVTVDVVGVLTPNTILSIRGSLNPDKSGFSYFDEKGSAALGFPASLVSQLDAPEKYPVMSFENYLGTGSNEGTPKSVFVTNNVQGNLSHRVGAHSIRYGAEYRWMYSGRINIGGGSGNYSFSRSWTNSNPNFNDTSGGNAIASFLLGYMGSASVIRNVSPAHIWKYPVLFFHDDWRVSNKLSLNLGLRWDYETPAVERHNRQERGFAFGTPSPIQAPGLNLTGGLLFAGVDGLPRGAFDTDRNNFQPRAGFAYTPFASRRLVIRGGAGLYYLPTTDIGGSSSFSATTSAVVGTPEFLPLQTLSDPFAAGLIPPSGSNLGLATNAGIGLTVNDIGRRIPNVWHFSGGFQYEFTPGTLLELTYAGSRSRLLQVSNDLNVNTKEQLALGQPYLNQSVPNPFYGVLPANTTRGAQPTISRGALLLPYPQFTSVVLQNQSLGKSWYNSLQTKFEQRSRSGLTSLASYTFSKNMETVNYLNPQDTSLSRELVPFHTPHRLVVSGTYSLPFGPGRARLSSGFLSHLIGGWEVGWTSTVQSGTPMPLSDFYMYGDPKLETGQSLARWFNTSREIWVQRAPGTLRTTKLRSPNLRIHSAPQFDTVLIRDFRIREGHRVQFKASAFNVMNTPLFNAPNTTPTATTFGVVPTTQRNLPRSIELGIRYAF